MGIEPISGYNGGKMNKIQSKIGLKWLKEIKNQIQNSHNFWRIYHKAGEQKIGNFYVDGYEKLTDTIYEFLGCFYHGCSDCFDLNKFNKKCSKMYGKLNAETMNRLSYLKKRCRNLVVMKECEYKDRNDDFNYKYPLKIRDALYGGRTSPAILYKDCFHVGKIFHVDFNSLYLSVQYKKSYPVRHPSVLINNEEIQAFLQNEIEKEENIRKTGFLKCKVLPPQNLLFPVLPTRINKKLLFVLCDKCAILKGHTKKCDHPEHERSIKGTWCFHEICEAME